MQLVDCEIRDAIISGILRITPYNREQINPNSYDLRLGDEFIYYMPYDEIIKKNGDDMPDMVELYRRHIIDPYDEQSTKFKVTHYVGEYFIIEPHQFVLARTIEIINIPHQMCAQIAGKSSLARLGLSIHQTGGFIDSGFSGSLTLELYNANCRPIKLYTGMRIAQLMYFNCNKPCRPYDVRKSSKYMGQVSATMSEYYKNEKPYQQVRE